MQKYKKIKTLDPVEFKRLMGVRPDTFQEMVTILREAETKRMSKGGKSGRFN